MFDIRRNAGAQIAGLLGQCYTEDGSTWEFLGGWGQAGGGERSHTCGNGEFWLVPGESYSNGMVADDEWKK